MLSVPSSSRQRRSAGAVALALSTLILLLGGAAPPATAAPSSPAIAPAAPAGLLSSSRTVAPAPGVIRAASHRVPAASVPKGLGVCGKRLWSSKYMRVSTAKTLVHTFINALRAGKGASAALGTAAAASGIGAPVGFAVTVLGWVASDFIINLVQNRLLAHFDDFRQIRFQLHVGCKGPFLYPKLRLGGKLKR